MLVVITSSCLGQTNTTKHYVFEASGNDEDFTSKVFEVLHNAKE